MKTTKKTKRSPEECFSGTNPINLKFKLQGTQSVRVVTLPGNMRMCWLAKIIMNSFNFLDYHLYNFEDKRFNAPIKRDGSLKSLILMNDEAFHERQELRILYRTIDEVFAEIKDTATFSYDYGDGWEISITRMADTKNAKIFECKKSEGMNAIEDIGGVGGLLRAEELCEELLENPKKIKRLKGDDKSFLMWLLGDDKALSDNELVLERLRDILYAPRIEYINEILKKYKDEMVLEGQIPEFYYTSDIADQLEDLSWIDKEER